jgi:ADP-dependent NAD(P)H-hydrate dehydratase / NAD(P)H-hydrate epimerase
VLPIVTPDEMAAVDAAATDPVEVLIGRAGSAVARSAVRMLGGTYGRVVNVIAGPGNNGNDGRVAARLLEARGVRVRVFDAATCPSHLPPADLVIDAAFGTGFRGAWRAPSVGAARVLAVDVPSGIDALTGVAHGRVLAAERTVTFAALKPGLLFGDGLVAAGEVEVADVGLDVGARQAHLLEAADVAGWMPRRGPGSHKWNAAVRIIAGSHTMGGAAALAAAGALRTGAGMVQVSSPGCDQSARLPVEAVQRMLPATGWVDDALGSFDRFHALVLGPGLGRGDDTAASTRQVAVRSPLPVVIDGDGLFALAWNGDGAAALLRRREAPTVLTPHDGEFRLLTGTPPTSDRIASVRRLASDTGSVVLLKGATTVVASPGGDVLVVGSGDERLATAGTGDVLAGIIGALVAMRVDVFEAAAMGAFIHGRAGALGPRVGLVASDLPDLVPHVLAELLAP